MDEAYFDYSAIDESLYGLSGDYGSGYDNFPTTNQPTGMEDFIHYVMPPIHLALSVVGNVLTALIMGRMVTSVSYVCVFPVLLAVADTMSLLLWMMETNHWFSRVTDSDFYSNNMGQYDTTCKAYEFTSHFIVHMSSWITVCIAIETYRTTVKPSRWHPFSKQRVFDTIVLLLVVFLLLNIHYFWTWGKELVELKDGYLSGQELTLYVCTFMAKDLQGYPEKDRLRKILDQIHWTVAEIFPMFVILVCLILIGRAHRKGRTPAVTTRALDIVLDTDGKQATCPDLRDVTFVVLAIAFIVFHLPYVVVKEINNSLILGRALELSTESELALMLATQTLEAWKMFDNSSKFIIYVATCGRFRADLCALFRGMFCRIHQYVFVFATKERLSPAKV